MSRIEVLVACMHQKDDSLYSIMNLQTDAVFANQCDEFGYKEYLQPNGATVKLVSTADRGVGKNRNKALMFASGDYLLFADEDMVYVDGYDKMVEEAFNKCPKADIVVFRLEYLNRFTTGRSDVKKYKKLHFWNSMRYGTARVAIRKAALDKACISFSVLYGGGAKYSCGEDSLFITDALKKGLKLYAAPRIIAQVKQETSTWFTGYNDKFFIDKGVLVANCFPRLKGILRIYYALRLRKVTKDYGYRKISKLIKRGFKEFEKL